MIYKWKAGARSPVSAQVAGDVCRQLESKGKLTPKALVDVSRPEDAPLHKAFEWDDAKAAEAYRETQAHYIIRSIEVMPEKAKEPVRAFLAAPLLDDGQQRCYKSTELILKDMDGRAALLESAKRELMAFSRKYRQLAELSEVITAAERLF